MDTAFVSSSILPTILFAEDDINLSQMYSQALKNHDLDVELALNGSEALDKIQNKHYDIMLLDIMMPVKSGVDVLREMPMEGEKPHIIILSNLMASDVPADIRQRADRYVVKAEMTPSALVELIMEVSRCRAEF